jgi:hypothetical protein
VILAGLVGLAFGDYGAEQERRGKSVAIKQQRPGEREILDRARRRTVERALGAAGPAI